MAELTSQKVKEVSALMLLLLENELAELGPAEAATIICHLAGRLMGRHGERTQGLRVSLDHWKDCWKEPSIQTMFEMGFKDERRNIS